MFSKNLHLCVQCCASDRVILRDLMAAAFTLRTSWRLPHKLRRLHCNQAIESLSTYCVCTSLTGN